MRNAGFIPERTSDPSEAFLLMKMDGAAVLNWGRMDPGGVTAGAKAVLGEQLRAVREPVSIVPNTTVGQATYVDWAERTAFSDPTVVEAVHIDGCRMYGDSYPDFLFLLCAIQAPVGGESFIVDGWRLLAEITADPGLRDLLHFLWRVPIEHSTGDAAPSRCPIVRETVGGRVSLRRHNYQRLANDASPNPEHQKFLDQWFKLTNQAVDTAPRFRLEPGDLFCLDNYRVFHGREPFSGQRLLHGIWSWSDMAFAVPDVEATEREAAEKARVAEQASLGPK
jgi:hypothetical protein